MTTTPRNPEHADKVERIAGAHPRLTVKRHLEGYAYSKINQNSDTTPEYRWYLLADGQTVDQSSRKRDLVTATRTHGADYLAEVDAS